jgi:hypothetical protein
MSARGALVCSALLLLSNLQFTSTRTHAWLSSLSLALAGGAYAVLQIRLRPGRRTFVRRLLLAGTFLVWAIDQLLPPGRLAVVIGDVVVAAFVMDLFRIIQEQEENGGGTNGEQATPGPGGASENITPGPVL